MRGFVCVRLRAHITGADVRDSARGYRQKFYSSGEDGWQNRRGGGSAEEKIRINRPCWCLHSNPILVISKSFFTNDKCLHSNRPEVITRTPHLLISLVLIVI